MSNLQSHIQNEILTLSDKSKIEFYTHFFRADKGDICYGDKFLAIKVPELRKLVKKYYKNMDLTDVEFFLKSEYNDMRFFGQQILLKQYQSASNVDQKTKLVEFMKSHIASINHWNLVDSIAYQLFGDFALITGDFEDIKKWGKSDNVWLVRIAIVSQFAFLKKRKFDLAISLVEYNINHPHEYIQKSNGWLLRSIGILDEKILLDFFAKYYNTMPSVTRSYASERLSRTLDLKQLFGDTKIQKL